MLALTVCIAVSTLISLIFKAFSRYGVRNLAAIVVNYAVCVVVGLLFEGSLPDVVELFQADWLWVAGVLGFFFIAGFNFNALAVQRVGIAVTSVVQRLSLLISVLFAVLLYREALSYREAGGILLGMLAVPLVVGLKRIGGQPGGTPKGEVWLPIGVFLLAGGIETFLLVAERSYNAGASAFFSILLFAWAGTIGLGILLLGPKPADRARVTPRDVLGGIALGIPNFFSIHLILVALNQGPAAVTVYPVLNVGTILLSALLAWLLFRERLSPKQWAGVALAVIAIVVMAWGAD